MRYLFSIIIAFCLSINTENSYACEVIDDNQQKLILQKPAQRIVSLSPDLTENLFAVGAGDKVVGVIRGSDYPLQAQKIPVVGSHRGVDLELILRLHPDLIVAWKQTSFVHQIKKLGLPVFISDPKKLADIPITLQKLGCLVGTEKTAQRVAGEFVNTLKQLKLNHTQRFSFFYQVWSQPLITVSEKSWINDVITLCGGNNIFKHLMTPAPVIDLEAVIVANPDVIIGTASVESMQKQWQKFPMLKAVQQNHFISIHPDFIERATPRILIGASKICDITL